MRAAPEPQRLAQLAGLLLGAAFRLGRLGVPHQPAEQRGVDIARGSAQLVAEPGVGHDIGAPADLRQQVAHRHHPLVQLRFGDVIVAPRHADQLGFGHPMVRVEQQGGQDDQRRAARQAD